MRYLWWFMLVAVGLSLAHSIAKQQEYRRRQTPLPTYAAGDVSAGLAFVLLIVTNLLDLRGSVAIAANVCSLALLAVAIVQSFKARRRKT